MLKRAGGDDELIGDMQIWELSDRFTAVEKAALRLTESMTTQPRQSIPPELWAELTAHFTAGEITELVACIGAFNAFNRMANALQVEISQR